ncbi:MAG: efflux RND transporter periplasmic adaptor subunit [Pirellulaceae bacterium]
MIAVFAICYIVCIWLIYIKLKIRPTPVNIAMAASAGLISVGAIVVLWQFSSPISNNLVVSRYTISIVPQVKGPIDKIYADANVPLKKGVDKLFEIQKTPYEYTVTQISASFDAANETVDQMDAGVAVAEAGIQVAIASSAAAKAQYESAKESENALAGSIGKVQLEQLNQQAIAAQANVVKATASKDQAVASLAVAKSTVKSIRANLDNAEFDLKQCTVYAPADGFVTNWQVREGTMAVPLPLAPMGTFIDTSEAFIVATFGQNHLMHVKPGDRAEIAFKSRPGQVFTGQVVTVIQASCEGQFTTTGQLANAASIHSPGKFAVKLKMDDDSLSESLAIGTTGTTAIYTDVGSPFQIISKVTVRIKAWMYYLMPL